MYGICEVLSHLTKSGVGCEIICSREGGCQIVGSKPTGKVTSLTSRIGWTKVFSRCSFPIEVEGFDVPCICHAHRDGGNSQGGTRHSLPPTRRWGGFNSNNQLNSSTER